MSKTDNPVLLKRFAWLKDIPEDEWDDMFPRQGTKWTEDEDDYLREWYPVDDIEQLSYALGRTPWKVQDRARKLGVQHTNGYIKATG